MQDARTRWPLLVLGLIIVIGSGAAYFLKTRAAAPAPIVITESSAPPAAPVSVSSALPPPSKSPPAVAVVSPKAAVSPKPAPAPKIFVHVAGAVQKPSLYALSPGCRVMQAIKAAGGAKASADLDAVNLAEKLTDGEKIYLPVKTTTGATAMLAPPGNTVGRVSVGLETPTPKAAGNRAKTAPAKPEKLSAASPGTVALNTATADELERLPGIGPAMAERILAYRHAQGGFQKTDELMEVSGIGPKKFAKIEAFVKLR